MFSIEIKKHFYIIYYNGEKLCNISKINPLKNVLNFFNIKDVKQGA